MDDDSFRLMYAESSTWAELYAKLGYVGNPGGGTKQRIRNRVESLGLDRQRLYLPPGPSRTWKLEDLEGAIQTSPHWNSVVQKMGGRLAGLRQAALDAGLDTSHLDAANRQAPHQAHEADRGVTARRVRAAAEGLAQAWYTLRGYDVFVPAPGTDPHADLIVMDDQRPTKVQVKSTTRLEGTGWYSSFHRSSGRGKTKPYTADEVDEFFLVTLSGLMYRLPFDLIPPNGKTVIGAKYEALRVEMFPSDDEG